MGSSSRGLCDGVLPYSLPTRHLMRKLLLVFLATLMSSHGLLKAQTKIALTRQYNVPLPIQYFEPSVPTNVAEVITGRWDSLFANRPLKESVTADSQSFWIKASIISSFNHPTWWILGIDNRFSVVDCYITDDDDHVYMQRSGWALPPGKRSVADAGIFFNCPLAAQQSVKIYLHVTTDLRWSTVQNTALTINDKEQWHTNRLLHFVLFGIYAGICLLAVFYWLLSYVHSRRINYLLFCGATISQLLLYFDMYGISSVLFFDSAWAYPLFKYTFIYLWIPAYGFTNGILINKLNSLRQQLRYVSALFITVIILQNAFDFIAPFYLHWHYTVQVIFIMGAILNGAAYLQLFYLWVHNHSGSARFAFICYFPALAGGQLSFLSYIHFLPSHLYWTGPVGAFVTVVILFYGMVDYIRVLRKKREAELLKIEQLVREQNVLLEKKVEERTHELAGEKERSNALLQRTDDLLLNILPAPIAEQLKNNERAGAKTYSLVTVMFVDFRNFSGISEKVSAELLVSELDYCFSAFDGIVQKHGIEKIKTVGDAYICAAGLPSLSYTHAVDTINAAIEMLDFLQARKTEKEARKEIAFEARVGIHSGPVVAGIVGVKKFSYDIWGDTVNTAARMEQNSETGRVNISQTTYDLASDYFDCVYRGEISAKNKGLLRMYFVDGVKPPQAEATFQS